MAETNPPPPPPFSSTEANPLPPPPSYPSMTSTTEPKKPSILRSFFSSKPVNKILHDSDRTRRLQTLPHYKEVIAPPPGYEGEGAGVVVPFDGASMFPNETVIYNDVHRDLVVSTDYDENIVRPLPIYYIAIGFAGGSAGENAPTPLVLHRGYDKTGPIYGYASEIERHATATLNNHIYDPSAPFATTVINVGAHLTKAKCEFEFRTGTPLDPTNIVLQKFLWKQCEGDPQVLALSGTRVVEGHDWSMLERKNKRGMKLFHVESQEVLAVFVAAKKHSRFNPVRISAKVRWLESARWTEELKLAAFLALMTYCEKTRRVGTGGGGWF